MLDAETLEAIEKERLFLASKAPDEIATLSKTLEREFVALQGIRGERERADAIHRWGGLNRLHALRAILEGFQPTPEPEPKSESKGTKHGS